MTTQTKATTVSDIQRCALVIVGAGIAGLNALYAASRYLKPSEKELLVERHARAGGMWTETYDHVQYREHKRCLLRNGD